METSINRCSRAVPKQFEQEQGKKEENKAESLCGLHPVVERWCKFIGSNMATGMSSRSFSLYIFCILFYFSYKICLQNFKKICSVVPPRGTTISVKKASHMARGTSLQSFSLFFFHSLLLQLQNASQNFRRLRPAVSEVH